MENNKIFLIKKYYEYRIKIKAYIINEQIINEQIINEQIINEKIINEHIINEQNINEQNIKKRNNNFKKYFKIIVNEHYDKNFCFDRNNFFITTFYCYTLKKGLYEKVYSDHIDFYLNDIFTSNNINEKITTLIKDINDLLEDYTLLPIINDFINKDIKWFNANNLFYINEIFRHYDFSIDNIITKCEKCSNYEIHTIDNINKCDFCERKLCRNCQSNENISFHSCVQCNVKWCIQDNKHFISYCEKNKNGMYSICQCY